MAIQAEIRIYGDRTESESWHYGFHDKDMDEFRVNFGNDYHTIEHDFLFWEPGYERGPWPILALALMKASARWPAATIYYGGQNGFYIVDGAFLMRFWEHYFGPNGNHYWETSKNIR